MPGKRRSKYGGGERQAKNSLRNWQAHLDSRADAEQYDCHPTTGRRLYAEDEAEFLRAADEYRKAKGKRFLTACDYLTVLKSLGYRKGES